MTLVFDEPAGLPPLTTDEGKVSQILRNFISNALKFTERGEVRVSATLTAPATPSSSPWPTPASGSPPRTRSASSRSSPRSTARSSGACKGTGLGLPLSRKLAELLGGTLTVESEPGVGSTFFATIPITYVEPEPAVPAGDWELDPLRVPVLVVEDNPEEMLVYEKFLKGSGFQVVRALTTRQARQALAQMRPAAIVLDILLRGEDAWTLLAEIKRDPATRDIPVLVVSTVDDQAKGMALGADAYAMKPVERRWLLDRLQVLTGRQPVRRVLVIDDDEISRYVVRGWLDDLPCLIIEAGDGQDGLRRARDDRPDAIVLDLVMPDLTGFEVLERLRAETVTRDVPVIIVTSKVLDDAERQRLDGLGAAIVSKAAERDAAVAQLRSVLVGAGLVRP